MRIPKIAWGASFANTLYCAWPLDNAQPYPEPRAGSEWDEAVSGTRDAWITGMNQMLEGDVRWIPGTDTATATGWDTATTGWNAFLQSAWNANVFNWYPDATLILNSSAFTSPWAAIGTPVNPGSIIRSGMTLQDIGDNDGAAAEGYQRTVTFGSDGVKTFGVFLRKKDAGECRLDLNDATASATRFICVGTFDGGGNLSVAMTGGTLLATVALPDHVYALVLQSDAVTAANTNQLRVFPAGATVSATGNTYVGGINVWDDASPFHTAAPDSAPLYQPCYLLEPMKGPPPIEATDGSRKLHLKIRTSDDSAFTGYPN